jgi:hypothetical protein
MNTTSGIITLKISEWSKITKITRIHRVSIVHKTLTINDKILVKIILKCGKFIIVEYLLLLLLLLLLLFYH